MVPAQPTQDAIQETADRLRPSRAGETVAMKAEAGSSYTASSAGLSSPRHLGRLREGGKVSPLSDYADAGEGRKSA